MSEVNIKLSQEHIELILNVFADLTGLPWKTTNPVIKTISTQAKEQAEDESE